MKKEAHDEIVDMHYILGHKILVIDIVSDDIDLLNSRETKELVHRSALQEGYQYKMAESVIRFDSDYHKYMKKISYCV